MGKTQRIETCAYCGDLRKIVARSMCNSCYHRLRRHGDPGFRKYKQPPRECSVRGCPRDALIQGPYEGICRSHSAQKREGRPIRTIDVNDLDEQGLKQCRRCGDWFPGDEHWTQAGTRCKSCVKDASVRTQYKTPEGWFKERSEQLKGRCACCGEDAEVLNVDHDHACCPSTPDSRGSSSCGGCVRDLLCTRCNLGLGAVNDDINKLKKMIKYLEKHRS